MSVDQSFGFLIMIFLWFFDDFCYQEMIMRLPKLPTKHPALVKNQQSYDELIKRTLSFAYKISSNQRYDSLDTIINHNLQSR